MARLDRGREAGVNFFETVYPYSVLCFHERRDAEARRGERLGAKESGERRWERCGSARLIFLSL